MRVASPRVQTHNLKGRVMITSYLQAEKAAGFATRLWTMSSVKEDVKLEEGKDTSLFFKIGSSVHNRQLFKDAPIATDCDCKGSFLNPGNK